MRKQKVRLGELLIQSKIISDEQRVALQLPVGFRA